MPEDLPGLARELRKETCPRRVIDAARRSIAAETPAPRPLRYVFPVAFAGLVLLGGLVLRWRPAVGNPGRPELVQQPANDSARAARQAQEALGLIGAVLLDAGVHSENVISDRAIPPLRNGLETAKNKIIHHTEL
jgi:hypothetical protein